MSPLPGQEQMGLARRTEDFVAYGQQGSVRTTSRRAFEYVATPDKETVTRELEEHRIETQRLPRLAP